MKRKTMLALMLAVSMTCSMGAATTAMAADDSATGTPGYRGHPHVDALWRTLHPDRKSRRPAP